MNLIIDIGNSFTKIAFFQGGDLVQKLIFKNSNPKKIKHFISDLPDNLNIIISSVKRDDFIESLYDKPTKNLVTLTHKTPTPLQISYKTPETLGIDRVAAAVGANALFPNKSILIVDFGTAITYDLVAGNTFLGGNISPGLETRFRSLHDYTDGLPKESAHETTQLLGTNTKEAIICGVQNGVLFETEAYIDKLSKEYTDLKVIFTGGDAIFFENITKRIIFAEPNLVFTGLNTILEYNL